eukprot:6461274-Ditylum_brightwellii.AAC.1
MNTCCHLGERLLKTEAKGISTTAQKWGEEIFTQQTCQRIAERAVIDHFGHLMKDSEEEKEAESSNGSFLQKQPNFKIYREKEEVKAFNRNGNGSLTNSFGNLMLTDGDATIEVYSELCLRNGQTV